MKWNKLNWEIPLALFVFLSFSTPLSLRPYIEKQTAYSNIPIGCDIQTWSEVIHSVLQENWAYLNIHDSWVYME